MRNGRCRLHGGSNVETQDHLATVIVQHGAYARYFDADDLAVLNDSKVGTLEAEIGVLRAQLARYLKLQQGLVAGTIKVGDTFVAEEHTIETSDASDSYDDSDVDRPPKVVTKSSTRRVITQIKRVPDFDVMIERYAARIASLEKTRAELLGTLETPDQTIIIKGGLPD